MTTISMPGTNAPPTSRRSRPSRTGLPRPGPSTNAASVAIDNAAMIDWLRPTTMVLRAIGSCTLRSRWNGVWPAASVASIVVAETLRIPKPATRINGGSA